MPDPRAWAREGRLMVVLAQGTRAPALSDLDGLLATDFLLQHPSVLERWARLSDHAWTTTLLPSSQEAESSEETLLRWKRSVADGVVVPILRRLIGRGLVERHGVAVGLGRKGLDAANRLSAAMAADRRDRVKLVTADFRADPARARQRLWSTLADGQA